MATLVGEVALVLSAGVLLVRSRDDLSIEPATMPRIVLVAGAATALAMLAPGLTDVLRVALFTVVYLALLVAVRAFPTEVVDALRRGRGGRAAPAPPVP